MKRYEYKPHNASPEDFQLMEKYLNYKTKQNFTKKTLNSIENKDCRIKKVYEGFEIHLHRNGRKTGFTETTSYRTKYVHWYLAYYYASEEFKNKVKYL